MRRSQALVALLLANTFVAGVAGGVAVDRLWLRPTPAAGGEGEREDEDHDREDGGDRDDETVIERFSEELELSSAQEARIDTILEHYRESMKDLRREVRPRYDALVDSARLRIKSVLDSAQARAYRRLLEREQEDGGEHGKEKRKERR